MKKLYILLFTYLVTSLSFGQTVFINEIHYDNSGGDVGEGVEIAGPAGTNLTTYTITAYNGSSTSGASYNSLVLSGSIPDEGSSGYGTVFFAITGLQNGAPDGLALDNNGTLIQFLSYEGSFTGVGGIADAVLSTDIGVAETSSTLVGESLQLSGTGFVYTDFSWNTPTTASSDLINSGQTFGTPVPTLKISGTDAPANGSTIIDDPETATPGNATIDFETTNFDVGEPGTGTEADGYIVWSVVNINNASNNDGGNIYTANDGFEYTVTGVIAGATYDFTSELVDNTGASLSPAAVYGFRITIAEYIDVADIAALRASTVDPDMYYRVTGQVINTNTDADTEQTMHFQDATGGIKVFDSDYEVQSYIVGDAVSNIRGHLESVNDVLQFVPTFADWGTPDSTGNTPAVQTVTIATLITSWEVYESELVNINGVTFVDAGGTFVAAIGGTGNYDISDTSGGPITFRTDFGTADYIGGTIPSGSQNIVVIVSEFFGGVQVTARSLSDFTLDSKSFEIEEFNMYPNPTSLGYVNISSKTNTKMDISVFDILGKQVLEGKVENNQLNVSSLNAGVYIMKASQGEAVTTKKLVIK